MGKEGLDRKKLGDSVRRVTQENERLKNKDETNFSIFDCLKYHSYKEHKSEKVKLGSFKCKQCNYVGVKQDSFEQHVRMKHANTKDSKMSTRHVCEFCDYESVSELNMRTHERDVHMRTKSKSKFPYEQCNKDFETSHHLHRHKQEVHTEKLFPCDVCNFTATNDAELSSHLEKNTRLQE